jgi:hypothetical protein
MINSIYIYPSDLDDRIVLILVGMTRDTRGKMRPKEMQVVSMRRIIMSV